MKLPRTDIELAFWLNNFSTSFAAHATALGFTEADVNSVSADAAMVNFLVGELLPTYKTALQARTSFKNRVMNGSGGGAIALPPLPATGPVPTSVPPGIIPRLRSLVQRIQLAPGYSEVIGLDLGIVGPDSGPDAPDSPPKPLLKARSTGPGTVQLDFSKETFDGVLVESRRPGEADWQSLGIDNYSPYVDDRPSLEAGKPEVRQYRVRYIMRDQATGEWSDIVTATFVP